MWQNSLGFSYLTTKSAWQREFCMHHAIMYSNKPLHGKTHWLIVTWAFQTFSWSFNLVSLPGASHMADHKRSCRVCSTATSCRGCPLAIPYSLNTTEMLLESLSIELWPESASYILPRVKCLEFWISLALWVAKHKKRCWAIWQRTEMCRFAESHILRDVWQPHYNFRHLFQSVKAERSATENQSPDIVQRSRRRYCPALTNARRLTFLVLLVFERCLKTSLTEASSALANIAARFMKARNNACLSLQPSVPKVRCFKSSIHSEPSCLCAVLMDLRGLHLHGPDVIFSKTLERLACRLTRLSIVLDNPDSKVKSWHDKTSSALTIYSIGTGSIVPLKSSLLHIWLKGMRTCHDPLQCYHFCTDVSIHIFVSPACPDLQSGV